MSIDGTNGNDNLVGTNGADTINAYDGNDTLDAKLGAYDYVYGGLGIDKLTIDYSVGDNGVGIAASLDYNGNGTARRNISSTSNTIQDYVSFYGIEQLDVTGTANNDSLNLDLSNRTFNINLIDYGTTPIDLAGIIKATNFEQFTLYTGSGNDTVTQSALVSNTLIRSGDYVSSGEGNDTLNLGLGVFDYANGGLGTDKLTIDYSVGDTGTGMAVSLETNGSGSARRNISVADTTRLDSISFNGIERLEVTGTSQNDSLNLDLSNRTANLNLINYSTAGIDLAGIIKSTGFETFSLYTGSGNDTVTQAGLVNGTLIRSGDNVQTGEGNDTIDLGLGVFDYAAGGLGTDKLTIDYSVGDTGTGMSFAVDANGNGTARRNISVADTTRLDSIDFNRIEQFNVTGTSKSDTLYGGAGNDVLYGGAGNDTINGFGGNDTIQGGFGNDFLDGGGGSDTVDYTTFAGNGIYNLTAGTANLSGAFIETMLNFESIIAGGGSDIINGTTGANTLIGGAGADTINGSDGDDYIQGGLGNDILDGGAGSDTVDYTTFAGNGTYNLTAGTAFLSGAFTETMLNFESIIAGGGNDIINGTTGANTLIGGAGADTINGSDGDDYIQGGLGQDILDGGAGFDTVDYTTFNGGGTYNLGLGSANLGVFTETMLNFESILTGTGNDTIIGSAGANKLNGGAGNDTLTGGGGNDDFYFGGAAISPANPIAGSLGSDTITDFTAGDKIVLSLAAFTNITAGGGLSFASVANAAGVASSFAKIVYNQDTHVLSYKNPAVGAPLTGIGSGGDFATVNLGVAGFNLTAGDFTVVA